MERITLQFGLCPGVGVDDAIIYLLHWALYTLYMVDFNYNSDLWSGLV